MSSDLLSLDQSNVDRSEAPAIDWSFDPERCAYSNGSSREIRKSEIYPANDQDDDVSSDDEVFCSDSDRSDFDSSDTDSEIEYSCSTQTNAELPPGDIHESRSCSGSTTSTSCISEDSSSSVKSSRGRRRKSQNPTKSPRPEDPKFKGVTVQFRTRVLQKRVQFLITAYFNCRKLIKRRWKHGVLLSTATPVLNDSHDPLMTQYTRSGKSGQVCHSSSKQCASCCTRKTPLWRDAEDGTPLCNACGIRYKKYRVRCGHCWFVPRKESKTRPVCGNCGEILRFSIFRMKPVLL